MRFTRLIAVSLLCLMTNASWGQNGWTNQTPSSEYPGLSGICAVDSEHVWAVGSEGIVIHSTNGGNSWDTLSTGFNDDFNTVVFLNRDTGFVSGRPTEGDAFILRTLDEGLNWQRLDLPTGITTNVNDIDFFYSESEDSIFIYAAGGLGHVWKSKAQGDNWIRLEGGCGNGNYNSCCIIDKNTGWFVGTPDEQYNYSIMATSNGGVGFYEQINPTQRKLNGVSFANDTNGIAVGLVGTIIYTDDGGGTWENRPNTGYRWQGVYLTNSGKAWVVGDGGNIGYSADYGYTWEMQESGLDYELWDVSFIDDNEGWIVGGGIGKPGIVIHTTTGGKGSTGIDPVILKGVNSLDQNHPNPVLNTTQISYHIQHPGMINISLYDILGNKLESLVNEFQLQGDYAIDFVNDHYPQGIYFYDLKVGSKLIQTKYMMILK